jgi:predicted amidohydrolase YtcJ
MEKMHLFADLVLLNANVKTMNPAQPTAQAVAIKAGKIVKVGNNQEIAMLIGKDTKVVNIDKKNVLPGLIDTHIHVADYGRMLMWLDLTSVHSIAELQTILRIKAAQTPVGKWIIGQGWNENRLKHQPTTADLDAAAPKNPVVLYREAAMVCVVNSKALALAGVNEQIAATEGGSIDRQNGKLTGVFRDTATNLIWKAVPEPTQDDLLDATLLALQKIVAVGITSIHWLVLSETELPIIQKLHDQNKLPLRVNVVVPESILEKAKKLKTADPTMLRFSGATVSVDGYLDSKEAALSEPYSDDIDNSGKLLCSGETLVTSVKEILGVGVQPILVAMGDRAIKETLQVIEQFPKSNVRFRIEQAAVLNQSLLKSLKKSGAVVSIQPKMISTEFTVWSAQKRLGLERARWLHPLRALFDAGVVVAGGSDCPMEPLNPMIGIQEVVTREAFPEQRLTTEEAIRMYTYNAAYSASEEKMKGSIEEEKLADLIVLTSDPEEATPDKIKDITVSMVFVGGKQFN